MERELLAALAEPVGIVAIATFTSVMLWRRFVAFTDTVVAQGVADRNAMAQTHERERAAWMEAYTEVTERAIAAQRDSMAAQHEVSRALAELTKTLESLKASRTRG